MDSKKITSPFTAERTAKGLRMKRHDINTPMFRSAGFDSTTGILELEHRNGSVRRWLAVPPLIYQAFSAASDPDSFFREKIYGRYLSVSGKSSPQ